MKLAIEDLVSSYHVNKSIILAGLHLLSVNPTKWSNTLKQFVCLTILLNWRIKG